MQNHDPFELRHEIESNDPSFQASRSASVPFVLPSLRPQQPMFDGYDPNQEEERHEVHVAPKVENQSFSQKSFSEFLPSFFKPQPEISHSPTFTIESNEPTFSMVVPEEQPVSPPKKSFFGCSSMRDPVFLILFLLNLFAFLFLFGANFYKFKENNLNYLFVNVNMTQLFLEYGILGIVSLTFCTIWIGLIRTFPKTMIIASLVVVGFLFIILGIFEIIAGAYAFGIWNIFCGIVGAFIYTRWKNKIQFASIILKGVIGLIPTFPSLVLVSIMSLGVTLVWISFWSYSYTLLNQVRFISGGASVWLHLYYFFTLFWVTMVIANVVHVTVGGALASWFFLNDSKQSPRFPTVGAFGGATTFSLGSICLGSLVVILVRIFRLIVQNVFPRSFFDCCCVALDRIFHMFNKFAFCQIAIYGTSYCKSAGETWNLLSSHGLSMVINNDIVGDVLLLTCVLGGLVSAFTGAIIARVFQYSVWSMAIGSFFIGLLYCLVIVGVVDSASSTIFICFAKNPEALQRHNEEMYEGLMNASGIQYRSSTPSANTMEL